MGGDSGGFAGWLGDGGGGFAAWLADGGGGGLEAEVDCSATLPAGGGGDRAAAGAAATAATLPLLRLAPLPFFATTIAAAMPAMSSSAMTALT